MSDTPLTDDAISQKRYYERRGEWHGDDVFLYVEPGDCRSIERELRERIAELEAERDQAKKDLRDVAMELYQGVDPLEEKAKTRPIIMREIWQAFPPEETDAARSAP